MSGRGGGKRRGRPPKIASADRPTKFQYHLLKKPKYLQKGDSGLSTPSASRASSPQDGSESSSRRSISRPSTSGRGRKSRGGTSKRGGHSTSFSKRGYESEYHYGSDFGDSSEKSDIDDDPLLMSASESDSLVDDNESDSDFSLSSLSNGSGGLGSNRRPHAPSPEPIWLQKIDVPELVLPNSSDDLMVPRKLALKVASIYEILRRFKHLVRLSPFRLEDMCAALMSEEQSSLLAEIHIMLLKAILREEDSQATHFGPLDQKDSVNIALYLIDTITWPEVLRIYVESDSIFDRKILHTLSTTEYPYTSLENRIQVLQFLVDQFLVTTFVRDDMLQEGPIHYDDHCRICHRLGDLLCCETCPAVYHLDCVDPPLETVPTEDWQCNLCKLHKVTGVTDCVSSQEKQGLLCRQEHVGYDRHGRKYWFISRRIFVENEDGSEIWYYSSVPQFEYLFASLDAKEYESGLCREISDMREEIVRQMHITENLTNQYKGNKKSYLEIENQNLIEKRKNDHNDVIKSDEKEKALEIEKQTVADEKSNTDFGAEEKKESLNSKNMVTRSKTGSLTPKVFTNGTEKRKTLPGQPKDELSGAEKFTMETEASRMTRHKLSQISSGTLMFKLGMENSFKSYINQFSVNQIALNKPQRNEERDKKRHLSHKFSLTTASEFKWNGTMNSSLNNVVATLRQTYLVFEQALNAAYMHPAWNQLRKVWISAINNLNKPEDFAKALIILQACCRNVLFANVWHDQLGHIKLQRITSAEREEKKKLEKREKRERDDEEERNRLAFNFIKYSLGLKHQVWKQKGEEYRIHGQWDWIWMSYSRRQVQNETLRTPQMNIKPIKIWQCIIDGNKQNKLIALNPQIFNYINEQSSNSSYIQSLKFINVEASFDEIDVSKALTQSSRLLYPKVAKKSKLDDLLDQRIKLRDKEEEKFSNPEKSNEIPTPTTDTKTQISGIERQLQLLSGSRKASSTVHAGETKGLDMDLINSLTKQIQAVRIQFGTLNRFGKSSRCYARDCNASSNTLSTTQTNIITCYSPLCLQKARCKRELLVLVKKAHTAGNGSKESIAAIMNIINKKPSILEQKLSEGKNYIVDSTQNIDIDRFNRFNIGEQIDMNDVSAIEREIQAAIRNGIMEDGEKLSYIDCIKNYGYVKDEKMEIDTPAKDQDRNINQTAMSSEQDILVKKENDPPLLMADEVPEPAVNIECDTQPEIEEKVAVENEITVVPDRPQRGRRKTRMSMKKNDDGDAGRKEMKTNLTEDGKLASLNEGGINVSKPLRVNRRFPYANTKNLKSEEQKEIKKEFGPDGITERVYSCSATNGKIYLKENPLKKDKCFALKQSKLKSKHPITSTFQTRKSILPRSIMSLPYHELYKMARSGGRTLVTGFHHGAKTNNSIWPYPCPRPLFKTSWLYRTITVRTLAAISLQFRIMWCTLKWDDMVTKPPTSDGKHQITTETEIITLEILRNRFVGRFMENCQYLRRKIVIPLELPKTVREVTSIRAGLRKRKMADTPQQTEPQVTEEWVDEDKLELWEIKQFGERLEKSNILPITRTATGKLPQPRVFELSSPSGSGGNHNSVIASKLTPEEIKEKMEQQLKLQRAAHNQKRALELQKQQQIIAGQKRKIIVKNLDGTTKIIQHSVVPPKPSNEAQKVQIIRGPDGKVSVRGLNPGQQLIQMPDGKLHVLSPQTMQKTVPSGHKVLSKPIQVTPGASSAGILNKQQVIVRQRVNKATPGATVVTKSPQVIPQKPITQKQIIVSGGQIIGTAHKQVGTQSHSVLTSSSQIQNILKQNLATGQKVIINQGGQKIILQQQPQTTVATSQPQQIIVQQNGTQNEQQQIVVSTASSQAQQQQQQQQQKIVQHYVNNTNAPQHVMIGNQKILLNPGQRIIAQQPVPTQEVEKPSPPPPPVQQVVLQQQPQSQTRLTIQPTQPLGSSAQMANDLAQGKLQIATVNGQQVLLRPLANNQAQIVGQIKTETTTTMETVMSSSTTPVKQEKIIQESPKEVTTVVATSNQTGGVSPTAMSPSVESLLQGQPPGTVIKCVTAQVVQTEAGPRIVLQGLAENNFTPMQLNLVQQQVKQQLLKAQESSGRQGVLGPTKIYLAVQPSQPQSTPTKSQSMPPLTPVQMVQDGQTASQLNSSNTQSIQKVATSGTGQKIFINGSAVALTGGSDVKSELRQRVLANNMIIKNEKGNILKSTEDIKSGDGTGDSFVLTPDYIQQTIKNALKQENLNPEIEEKLLNLQRYQERQMKTEGNVGNGYMDINDSIPSSSSRKRQYNKNQEDDDWILETPKRRYNPPFSRSEKKQISHVEEESERRQLFTEKTPVSREKPVIIVKSTTKTSQIIPNNETIQKPVIQSIPKVKQPTAKEIEKRQLHLQNQLYRHKEKLKKDMAKKRLLLEKSLQIEIQRELVAEIESRNKRMEIQENAKNTVIQKSPIKEVTMKLKKNNNTPNVVPIPASPIKSAKKISPVTSVNAPSSVGLETKISRAKKISTSDSGNVSVSKSTPTNSGRRSRGKGGVGSSSKKKEKLFCICRTPYDDSKFYVGCDLCNNWFHGDCVGITEEASKAINEFVCSECKHARDTQELYCLCRKPYDETQFYICCDKCQDWFHGRCVGILQSEADSIDEYICPNCQKNNQVNFANMKSLSELEYDNLKKLVRQIQSHKCAWPFMEPVAPNEAPDYYQVIKDPMDLQKIESKINSQSYSILSEFIGDMTKIFDNCRFYNPKESTFYKCAESLEAYFVQKIKYFRENLVEKSP